MKLETFFEKFDQVADAPDAMAKMREIVLELAVHGKLNQGNSADRKGWSIKRLKDLTSKIGSGSTPHGGKNSYHVSGTPLIRSMNVHFRKFVRDGLAFIDDVQAAALSNVIVEPNDVLLNITGASIGRVTTAPKDMAGARVNQHVAIIRTRRELLPRFLEIVLASPTFQSLIDGIQVGATREALTKRMIEEFEIPLPATSEQISVISRVDELMGLCDRLEAQQKERETWHAGLTRAAVARFDEAPTPANLNFLFHPTYSVTPADLRKTILNLAVQGKLVSQDSDSEPARLILERITQQKKSLLAAKQFRQGKVSRPQSALDAPTRLPSGWSWVNVDSLCFKVTDGTHFTPHYVESGVRFVSAKDIIGGALTFDRCKFISQEEHDKLYRRCNPEYHDIVISKSGSIGAVALIEDHEEFSLFESLALLKFDQKSLLPQYLIYALTHACSTLTAGHIRGVGVKHLHLDILRGVEFALPPLDEQSRIVARVDQLMGLVDQLETQLAAFEKTTKELLDAVIHELLHPAADIIEFPRSESDRASQRAAIGCYAIEYLARNPSFGRTMLMKACYLSEAHLGLPLGWQPMRQAAGPWDPWLQDFESLGTRSDWFAVTEKALNNGHSKIEYSTKKGIKTKTAEAIKVLGSQKAEFDRLLDLFADKSTEDAEIIATLFAAWNDFLIDGKSPTDEEIIREVRENWHQRKERFSGSLLARWLGWMRANRLIPKGRGPRTIQQFRLQLQ